MKTHQELHIKLTNSIEETILNIENHSFNGWTRNKDSENELNRISGSHQFCFEAKGVLNQELRLWIVNHGNELVVTNIVPQKESLTISQYNLALNSFVSILKSANLIFSLSEEDLSLEDLIGEVPAKYFKAFSGAANKATGRSHPCDEKRWFVFLYSMIKSGNILSTDDLVFFLTDDGWQESTAYELALDLEYGINAMKFALGQK